MGDKTGDLDHPVSLLAVGHNCEGAVFVVQGAAFGIGGIKGAGLESHLLDLSRKGDAVNVDVENVHED